MESKEKALIGLLTGARDPASPILWNLFLADLKMMPDMDNTFLAALHVSRYPNGTSAGPMIFTLS